MPTIKTTSTKAEVLTLPEQKLVRGKVYLVGTAPLIVHAFPEKAGKQIITKQMSQTAKVGKKHDIRDPDAEFNSSRYILPDGRDGFPAVGFKAAAVTACTSIANFTKIAARQAFRIAGIPQNHQGFYENAFQRTALVPLFAEHPVMREDVVRLSGPSRAADLRYRPEYEVWGAELDVTYNASVIDAESIYVMFQAAGHGVGIGDYRPEKDGDCGTFEPVGEDEWQEFLESFEPVQAKATTTKKRKAA